MAGFQYSGLAKINYCWVFDQNAQVGICETTGDLEIEALVLGSGLVQYTIGHTLIGLHEVLTVNIRLIS